MLVRDLRRVVPTLNEMTQPIHGGFIGGTKHLGAKKTFRPRGRGHPFAVPPIDQAAPSRQAQACQGDCRSYPAQRGQAGAASITTPPAQAPMALPRLKAAMFRKAWRFVAHRAPHARSGGAKASAGAAFLNKATDRSAKKQIAHASKPVMPNASVNIQQDGGRGSPHAVALHRLRYRLGR